MNHKIYLIRHAQTLWSQNGRHTGTTDLSLIKEGEIQAKQLGKYLQTLPFKKVLLSPLKRARETYALSGLKIQPEICSDLKEWNYGQYEGLTTEEILKKDQNWCIFTKGAPGGESVLDIQQRADRVLKKIEQIKEDVAIFSSGHFLRALAARWLSLAVSEGRLFFLEPASVSILGYERTTRVLLEWNRKCF